MAGLKKERTDMKRQIRVAKASRGSGSALHLPTSYAMEPDGGRSTVEPECASAVQMPMSGSGNKAIHARKTANKIV